MMRYLRFIATAVFVMTSAYVQFRYLHVASVNRMGRFYQQIKRAWVCGLVKEVHFLHCVSRYLILLSLRCSCALFTRSYETVHGLTRRYKRFLLCSGINRSRRPITTEILSELYQEVMKSSAEDRMIFISQDVFFIFRLKLSCICYS